MIKFTQSQLARIKRLLQAFENGDFAPPHTGEYHNDGDPIACYVVKTSSAVTALSGTAPGTGTATIQSFDGTNLSDAGLDDIDVFNLSDTTIPTATYALAVREPYYGAYFLVEGGGGDVACIVRCTFTANLNIGSFATATVNAVLQGSGVAVSDTITVHDHLGDFVQSGSPAYAIKTATGSSTSYELLRGGC